MELNNEELDRFQLETGKHMTFRVNAFVGDDITDIKDPAQRKQVVDELIRIGKLDFDKLEPVNLDDNE